MTGRNLIGVETGVLLDLRSLSSVSIAEDKASAIVGAGILTRDLASTITAAGLFTPIGWHPMVGYAGWAMGGGYGMFSSAYGLGVDQILGARLVTADGSIIDVDETSHPDLLWAIRGAGNGIWGVVTQLKIKIYPQPKLLIGTLQYQKEDWPLVMMDWAERFEANLPIEFAGDIYLRNPTIDRPEMTFFFAWCAKPGEDIELGYEFLDRMRSLPGSATERISEVDLASFLRSIPSAQSAPVHLRGVITTGLTKAVASVLNRQWNEPRPLYMGIPSHFAHGQAVQPNPKACFPLRYPHRLFPLVCSHPDMLKDKYFESAVTAMADRVVRELKDTTDVLEGVSYGSLIPAIDTEITATFGTEALNRLRALKALYDPTGLFSGGYPALDRTT
ncbi:FAD/FMN-containing dehydrogenase [Purpureocillium lavendulum]|uniref:FAD/FMN-containing dehydrogenase n=1 Tax=Purpureocillium lavendulum TaxID=1247861 RepID=A0AB34FM99_9HYPO|nr:FAD/FMN-containing dehydrogenase [Purpureocillium lavendulum]